MNFPRSAQEFAKAAKRSTIGEKELLEAIVEIDMEPVRITALSALEQCQFCSRLAFSMLPDRSCAPPARRCL